MNMYGVTQMDRVRNEVVKRRTGVTRDIADCAEHRVWRRFGLVERIVKRIIRADVSEIRLRMRWMDRYCEGSIKFTPPTKVCVCAEQPDTATFHNILL